MDYAANSLITERWTGRLKQFTSQTVRLLFFGDAFFVACQLPITK